MSQTPSPSRAPSHLPATSSGSVPAVTRAARVAGRRGSATARGIWAAVGGRRGFRAEAFLLHLHHHCRRHHVLITVPPPAPPLPLALYLLHAEIRAERRKRESVALLSLKEMTGLTPGLPLPGARSPRNPRGGELST